VKHYSSGMYMRLAFAVAAHLEPEILIVDEVLAVGDAEFQRKCLGKMGDVARQGRTVFFVSHNMAAVRSLTTRGLVLNSGRAVFTGTAEAAIQTYVQTSSRVGSNGISRPRGRGIHATIVAVRLLDEAGCPTGHYIPGQPLRVEVDLETDGSPSMSLEVFLVDAAESRLGMASLYQFHGVTLPTEKGTYRCRMELAPQWLASGTYSLEACTSVINVHWDHVFRHAYEFDVPFSNPLGREFDFRQSFGYGSFALPALSPLRLERISDGRLLSVS